MEESFNCDPVVAEEVLRLKERFGIKTAVETGTYHGTTTRWFAEHFDKVYSAEINEQNYIIAKAKLMNQTNVEVLLGNSPVVLETILPKLEGEMLLFYLDAHWNQYWPLLDEMKVIAKTHKNNCVIVIDDFKVPHRTFQYDSYGSTPNDVNFIEETMKCVFDNPFYYYNNRSLRKGNPVGKIYIVPDGSKVADCTIAYSNI